MEELQKNIDMLLEKLYQEEDQSYTLLVQIMPLLEAVIVDIADGECQQQIVQGLQLVMQAMELGDMTLTADYLQYEVMDRLVEEKRHELLGE